MPGEPVIESAQWSRMREVCDGAAEGQGERRVIVMRRCPASRAVPRLPSSALPRCSTGVLM